MVAFVRNGLVKMTLRLFQSISVVMTIYGANASEAVRKISKRTLLELCQLTKTANFIATPMKKRIQQCITGLLEIQTRFLFFLSWQIKMSNLLHAGLILIIGKVFTSLCLLCLCRNREYPGDFQSKKLISKLFLQISAEVKWEGMPV